MAVNHRPYVVYATSLAFGESTDIIKNEIEHGKATINYSVLGFTSSPGAVGRSGVVAHILQSTVHLLLHCSSTHA